MITIFIKELTSFFSSITGFLVLSIFLLISGLFVWVFSNTSILNYNYASMGQFFTIAPLVFLFLIPAITMQSFADEKQNRTIELLFTKPLTDLSIIGGKYLAALFLVFLALLPTLIYYLSIHNLGSPIGNIDDGAVIGSYLGLICLASVFVSLGIFISALTNNQIVAFVLSAFLSFVLYFGFDFVSDLPVFFGRWDAFVKNLGISYHYDNISKGRVDSRDVLYFLSVTIAFLWFTFVSLDKRRW